MLIYLVTFSLSLLCYAIAIRAKSRMFKGGCLFLCIVIPALLAGLRDPLVGKDYSVYGEYAWNAAISSASWKSYIHNSISLVTNLEIFYLFFNFFTSRFSDDFHVFFFVHQFCLMCMVVYVALKCRKYKASTFILFFYFFALYNISFNLLRQIFALVFSLIAFLWLIESNRKKSVLFFLLSCLAHKSSYFAVFILALRAMIGKFRNNKLLLITLLGFIFIAGFSSFTMLMNFMISSGLYSDHYSAYVGMVGFKTHKIDILFLIGIIFCLIFFIKKKNRAKNIYEMALFMSIISILFHLFGSLVEIAARVALYYEFPLCILLLMSSTKKKDSQKLLTGAFFLLLCRWFYLAIVTGYDWTIPYTSRILGI